MMAMTMELMDGNLFNTAFAVYAPDGETKLTRTTRSPRLAFGGRSSVAGLRDIAGDYPGRDLDDDAHTPDFTSTREAINIAACDSRPLVIALGPDDAACDAIEARLRALAWSPEFVGRVHWDFTADAQALRELVPDVPEGESGVFIVQPEPFGRSAAVIGTLDSDASLDDQRAALQAAMDTFESSFTKLPYEEHVEAGHDMGVTWEEAIRMRDRPRSEDSSRGNRDRGQDRNGDRGRRNGRQRNNG